ncbi:MAG: ABC transporter permease/ATP-binding protein [Candidatus Tokpelaia hoelldobleri]|uniref:ABC transporter permease/ATP-binding protein n=1 Tax=Candidatus Tokpelaia hoelldobleri TaxID=1902579 RepID=A0A1U9JWZ0_9HYPH|nr:MAG: ABC transporter permease/ATP-binding protein [Candidatus Tokpelaia hoelldoblerii]
MADSFPSQQTNHRITAPKKHNLRPLARLYPYIGRNKRLVCTALVALFGAAGAMLALPVAVRRMLDHGFTGTDGGTMNSYFIILLALAAFLALTSAIRYYSVITLGERVVADLRRDVFAHLSTLSTPFYDRSHSGELVSRLAADTTQIRSAVGATASIALRNLIMAIGAIIMMVVTSVKLSALVLLAIPVVVIPLIGFGRKVRAHTRRAQDRLADANALAGEQISAMRTVQAFNAEHLVSARFSALVNTAFRAARQSILSRALLTGLAIFMVFGSVVGVLWIGSHDTLNGTMSAGALGQFVLYAIFAASAFGQLSEVGAELAQATGAAERLAELLDEKATIKTPENPLPLPEPPQGNVVFDHVRFAYPVRPDITVLADLSFTVKAGETVAIVGASGAGKSTIFSLLLRFYDPLAGTVSLDGVDLRQADLHQLRTRFAYVAQDLTIFDGTLRDNIAFGCETAREEDIIKAARAANAYDFITALPEGPGARVGERGLALSGGQKQRIAIARAILRNAPVLLLDEATSALDAESEQLVQKALEGLMKNRTTLVIAHRLATVLKADRIVVIQNGQIVETGKHESLMKQDGFYARLARLQFAGQA